MKSVILLISAGIFHPSLPARAALWRALSAMGEFSFQRAGSIEALAGVRRGDVRGAVIFLHRQKISQAALSALERFADGGGGVLAVHSATASFKQQPRYFAVLGGRFRGHGPIATYTAHLDVQQAEPFEGLPAFTVRDELYLHDLHPDVRVHYSASCGDEQAPVVWTYLRGAGRVCYVCPGHRAASLHNPSVIEIMQRGLRWAVNAAKAAA